MARAYLGDTIDLHSGGEDNKFPHHECEIAQSEALTGKPFSNHWTHTAFLQVNGQKMAKSAGNFYTVRGLVADGADPLAIRFALIGGVYRKPFNFTDQGLNDAATNLERFRRAVEVTLAASGEGEDKLGEELAGLFDDALEAMCSDLNTPVAIAKALEGARLITREGNLNASTGRSAKTFLERVELLLGIIGPLETAPEPVQSLPAVDEIRILGQIEARKAAKAAKNWGQADDIRKVLLAEGIVLTDNPDGTVTWSRA
jgi:cysteinyl-tRNA synthetase